LVKIRRKQPKKSSNIPIEGTQPSDKIKQYFHNYTKRTNNPPVGLVTPETDIDMPQKQYSYDPHLDPQIIWTGKQEHTNFEVNTVSLHVHERIDPMTIIEKVLKTPRSEFVQKTLFEFFNSPENNPPLREAIEFYKHDQSWSNRLIAGDSLLIMNSFLERENLAEKIQTIYIDPPYGIKYGSNFQPFINKREVKDGKDEDLTQEPETIKAFRDTWELGIHSYLTYLRDRLLLSYQLLHESGSLFVQISDENVHLVRCLIDEIFGSKNFVALIPFKKTSGLASSKLDSVNDYLIFYAKNIDKIKYRQLFKDAQNDISSYTWIQLPTGEERKLTSEEKRSGIIPEGKLFRTDNLTSQSGGQTTGFEYTLNDVTYRPSANTHWKTNLEGMKNLEKNGRLIGIGSTLAFKRFKDDFPVKRITNWWDDTVASTFSIEKYYVVQTYAKIIERCILMTTDPGDLVFDPTCGSGTTAYACEKWGRRWITCDSSRVSIAITKQRLMTNVFEHFTLLNTHEGIQSGFKYKTVQHIKLSTLSRNEPIAQETLYDQPVTDKTKIRICGPFTVEAVPSPTVKSVDTDEQFNTQIDMSLSRAGETLRQDEWRNELLKTGIRGKSGQKIEFSRVEIFSGAQWLHVDAETKEQEPKRTVISFGPEHAPLEQKQVSRAIDEAQKLVPKPKIIVFAAFQFDPEASKDIDELNWPGVTILKAQMNADLLTEDLKKERSSNESFWLMGKPDVELKKINDNRYIVEVNGFDYFNTEIGEIESGDSTRISMWMLDTDYDGRSLYPQQIFFPMSGTSDGWNKLSKTLKVEINEELLEQYRGTRSLPFVSGGYKQVAVEIVDDRGIESLRILKIE